MSPGNNLPGARPGARKSLIGAEAFSGRFSPVHAFVSASAWAVATAPRPGFPWNNATGDILGDLALAHAAVNGTNDGDNIWQINLLIK